MKYLFIDTETTGLPVDKKFFPKELDNWPRLVSVAYILCEEREIIDSNYYIIKPNGFIIPSDSTKIHGITTAEAISKGSSLTEVLQTIGAAINDSDIIVGHNAAFDVNVLNSEYYRYNETLPVSLKPRYSTMELSKDYCHLPNNDYPTLEELYSILKGASFSNPHNAYYDVRAIMECFWLLNDIGLIKTETAKPIVIYPTEDNILWAADHVSTDYVAKVYAFLTIVNNYFFNKRHFLEGWYPSAININKEYEAEIKKLLGDYAKDCSCALNPHNNADWINRMFDFFTEKMQVSTIRPKYNRFLCKTCVTELPSFSIEIKQFGLEIGGKELIEKFELKSKVLNSTHGLLFIEDEHSCIDIACTAIRKRIQAMNDAKDNFPLQKEAETFFISMVDYFNEVRQKENSKRIEREIKSFEETLDPKKREETEKILKNYADPFASSSSSGCMIILPLFFGIGASLYYIVEKIFL